ncbi:hypothetical protein [Pontibacter fetidus]|uniref:DUF349 domain-containing protein n=1 Tax=Pontibacter fetidus TaxID=2700082 RepID=A0A6B2H379_9BACT|nr:hypothetical protein [Pontibacter fetidus]NDK56548.1 hypothetical protein [Pontibacter fetidus]
MNKQNRTINWLFAALLVSALFACERTRTVEEEGTATDRDTTIVTTTGETTEEKLEELRGWMNKKANSADTAIREDWPQTREKLRRINEDIERNFDSLSAESKEEYRQLKHRYENWESRQERRQRQPLNPTQIKTWEEQLLREYKDIAKIEPTNIREAYLTFMSTVRIKKRNWTQNDWDYVDYVYGKLNDRLGQIEGQISTGDRLKIRTLQAEYLALEGAADTRNMLNSVDEK